MLSLFSCHTLQQIPLQNKPIQNLNFANDTLTMNYWGVGCFHIRYKNNEVIADPFISRPSFGQVAFGKIKQDTMKINDALGQNKHVAFVIAGHGHYDHAMDIPHLDKILNNDAIIVGSQSLQNQLSPYHIKHAYVCTSDTTKKIIVNSEGSVRIMSFPSNHASHFMGLHLYHGKMNSPLQKEPLKSSKWKDGPIMSFIIDFMEKDNIEKRIFIQTSSASSIIKKELQMELTGRPPDLYILNYYTLRHDMKHKNGLISLTGDSKIIVCHWENFFRSWDKKIKPLGKWDTIKTLKKLQGIIPSERMIIPIQGSRIEIP